MSSNASLREKMDRFEWDRVDDDQPGRSRAGTGREESEWPEAEREHRRRSRAFAAAAKKTADASAGRTVSMPVAASDEPRRTLPPPPPPQRKRKRTTEAADGSGTGLFHGLAFYYIPDAALGPRKLRIAKAQQHGAQWVRHLDAATHVIVDKKLSWADIQGVEGVNKNNKILVTEEYPLDCIGFRCLLEPDQRRYHIAGRPSRQAAPAAAEDHKTAIPAVSPPRVKADTSKTRRRLGTPPRSRKDTG